MAAAARARWRLLALPLALLLTTGSPRGLDAAPKPPVPKAISVFGFDVRDALVGHAVAYEFDMEVGRKVVPVRLLEDVNRWDFVDLPIFRSQADADDTTLAEIGRGSFEPTLPPF
ncbi:hypothetical protein D1007_46304 [Hordeum vulgare]|nr:hypothetical protein D1007_46304 [Hordeum vulgare]